MYLHVFARHALYIGDSCFANYLLALFTRVYQFLIPLCCQNVIQYTLSAAFYKCIRAYKGNI